MAEAILYTLEIKGTQTELDRLALINKNIDDLKTELKTLSETDKKAAEEKKIQLKAEQEAYRNLQKEVTNNNKVANNGIKTLGSMRAELANMNKELDKTKVGSERFKQLTSESKKLRDEIKGADEATGRFQANVGDYKNQIMNAFQSMGIPIQGVSKGISTLSSGMTSATSATTGTSKALNILKIALIATGIGAIVVAVGALAAAFFSTQKGVDALNKVLIPIKTTFQRLWGIMQDLGTAAYNLISGNWSEFAKDVDNIKDSFSNLGDEINQAVADGKRLAQIIIDIDNAKLKLAQNEGRLSREMAEQKEIIENLSLSDEKRKAAGEKFLSLSKELKNLNIDIANLEYEQARIKSEQNDTDRETQIELAQKKEAANAIEAAFLQKQQEIKNKITTIDKATSTARLKQIEAEKAASKKAIEEIAAANLKALKEFAQSEMDAAIQDAMLFIERTDKALADEDAFQQKKREIQESYRLSQLTNEEFELFKLKELYDQKLLEEADYQARKKEITDYYIAEDEASKKEKQKAEMARMAASLGTLKSILGEESKAGKAAGIAQATINTYQGITEVLKTKSLLPEPLATISKIINVGTILATGLKAVGAIKNTPEPKFAKGVIGLRGGGSETSDSIDAKLSKDESVMTAKVTRAYAPILADMERSVGNTPNIQIGNRRFASGFIAGNINPRREFTTDSERVLKQVLGGVLNIPVVVSETDITSTQESVRKIKVRGDL